MIIIKSQDKSKLIKTSMIIVVHEEYYQSGNHSFIRALSPEGIFYNVAEYRNKKRAEEVMEQIEEYMREQYLNKMITSMVDFTGVSFTQVYDLLRSTGHKNEAIFTMPKE